MRTANKRPFDGQHIDSPHSRPKRRCGVQLGGGEPSLSPSPNQSEDITVEFKTIDELVKNLRNICSASEFHITTVNLTRISDDELLIHSNPSVTLNFLGKNLPTTVTHLTMNHLNLRSGCAFAGDDKVDGLLRKLKSLLIFDGCIESELLLSEDFAQLKQIKELAFTMPAFREPTVVDLAYCLGDHLVRLSIDAVANQEIASLEFPKMLSLSLVAVHYDKYTLSRHTGFFISPENGDQDEDDEDSDGEFMESVQLVNLPKAVTCNASGCPRLSRRFEHARDFDMIGELCTIVS